MRMLLQPLLCGIVASYLVNVALARVNLDTIHSLTKSMVTLRSQILDKDQPSSRLQHALRRPRDVDHEHNVTVTALHKLGHKLQRELNKPLLTSLDIQHGLNYQCASVHSGFYAFISAGVNFLFVVQEEQEWWQWKYNDIAENLRWLQALWASRKANTTQRSFIEQQMQLYAATGCFTDSHEVLKRNVEMVEYLNDLIDTYR